MFQARYCHRRLVSPSKFDKRSFRTVKSGKALVRVGCLKGKWNAKRKRCKTGTRAQAILKLIPSSGRCPAGSKRP